MKILLKNVRKYKHQLVFLWHKSLSAGLQITSPSLPWTSIQSWSHSPLLHLYVASETICFVSLNLEHTFLCCKMNQIKVIWRFLRGNKNLFNAISWSFPGFGSEKKSKVAALLALKWTTWILKAWSISVQDYKVQIKAAVFHHSPPPELLSVCIICHLYICSY